MRSQIRPGLRLRLHNIRKVLTTLLILAIPLSSAVHPATQGTSGSTSAGDIEINFVTGLNVRLSGLTDFNFGTWTGGDLAANDNLCVGRTGVGFFGSGNFRINASGDGEPGDPAAFTLTNGTDLIYYNAFFNDAVGTAGRLPLTPGVTLTGQTGNGFPFILNYIFGCVTENANISVQVSAAEITSPAGAYTGTLTLLLVPE